MTKANYIPAIGEQFNSVWNRGLKYKGKDGQMVQIKCNYMAKEKVTFYGVA